jgi:uncharacterized Fe-S cluster-containing MiaB family protein
MDIFTVTEIDVVIYFPNCTCKMPNKVYKETEVLDELYSEQKLKKIFFYHSLSSRGCSHPSHAECVMCMQRNGYSFTVFFR